MVEEDRVIFAGEEWKYFRREEGMGNRLEIGDFFAGEERKGS